MVIDNLDVKSMSILPSEDDPVLGIHSYGMMICKVALKLFKAVTGWHPKVVQNMCSIEHIKFPTGNCPDGNGYRS